MGRKISLTKVAVQQSVYNFPDLANDESAVRA